MSPTLPPSSDGMEQTDVETELGGDSGEYVDRNRSPEDLLACCAVDSGMTFSTYNRVVGQESDPCGYRWAPGVCIFEVKAGARVARSDPDPLYPRCPHEQKRCKLDPVLCRGHFEDLEASTIIKQLQGSQGLASGGPF